MTHIDQVYLKGFYNLAKKAVKAPKKARLIVGNTHNRKEGENLNQKKQAKRQNLEEKSENNAHQQAI